MKTICLVLAVIIISIFVKGCSEPYLSAEIERIADRKKSKIKVVQGRNCRKYHRIIQNPSSGIKSLSCTYKVCRDVTLECSKAVFYP